MTILRALLGFVAGICYITGIYAFTLGVEEMILGMFLIMAGLLCFLLAALLSSRPVPRMPVA